MKIIDKERVPASTDQMWFVEHAGRQYGVLVQKDGTPTKVTLGYGSPKVSEGDARNIMSWVASQSE